MANKPLKIVLDPQIFNQQKYGGISRYYTEIFSNLLSDGLIDFVLPLKFTSNFYLKESKLINTKQLFFSKFIELLSNLGISLRTKVRKSNDKAKISCLDKQDFDLFIPTYYDTEFLKHNGNKPFVLTVYDMIHELFPSCFKDSSLISSNKLLLMEKATKIIAVSNNTKRDILAIYPHISEEKIKVIYHGNSIKIDETVDVELPSKYLLFVGDRKHYKNFKFLVKSIKELLNSYNNLFLICAGGGQFSKEEVAFLKSLNLTGKVVYKKFKDNELGKIYKNALAFVFPSGYEGFGIPVLESMACGCPVVLTNNSSFPEVAGDAGVFFKLDDEKDLQNKIKTLLDDPSVRNNYIERGLQRVRIFDWKDASKLCFQVYEEALGL